MLEEKYIGFNVQQTHTNFPKIYEPPQNSRCHKGDMKQVPYRGFKNIWGTKVQNLVTVVTLCLEFFIPDTRCLLLMSSINQNLNVLTKFSETPVE